MDDILSLQMLDVAACAGLAASAAMRARALGAKPLGAMILGCISGLCAPLLREALLHGTPGSRMVFFAMPEAALCGAVGGIIALIFAPKIGHKLFVWVDGAGIGLAACLCACMGLAELGIAGALVLGMLCGLAPGLLRDVALGDTAMLVDEDWYAAAPAIGIMLTISLPFGLAAAKMPILPVAAVAAGWILALALRVWKGAPRLE